MQLEFFWIKSFKNIVDQEFNLGGKYFYSASKSKDNTYFLSRKENTNFIKDFFKIGKTGFTNVSAVVGENGAGKTNTLNFIRGLITNKFIGIDMGEKLVLTEFIAVFSASNEIFLLQNLLQTSFSFDFDYISIDKVPNSLQTIFFIRLMTSPYSH